MDANHKAGVFLVHFNINQHDVWPSICYMQCSSFYKLRDFFKFSTDKKQCMIYSFSVEVLLETWVHRQRAHSRELGQGHHRAL